MSRLNVNQIYSLTDDIPFIDIPIFSAYLSSTTNVTNNTSTKVVFDVVEYDSHNYYSSSTGRYTPLIAGYYRFDFRIGHNGTTLTQFITDLNLNNVKRIRGNRILGISATTTAGVGFASSGVVYMNGTTDYVEVYGTVAASSGTAFYGINNSETFFQGQLIKKV